MNEFDEKGYSTSEKNLGPRLEILEYILADKVPLLYLKGPPQLIYGDSPRACALIYSLAQVLTQQSKVAICEYTKTKRGRPHLGALFPFDDGGDRGATNLIYMQLPYLEDVKLVDMESLEKFLDGSNSEELSRSCDDLVEAFMLPSDALVSGFIPNPSVRSWHQTLIRRALDDKAPVVSFRSSLDQLSTPSSLLQKGLTSLETFLDACGLEATATKDSKIEKKGSTKGKKILTYQDYL
jgi:hypothetical protein